MDSVNWTLVASLVANTILLWQLYQQKQEHNHSRKESLIAMVRTSMKALHACDLELKTFATLQNIDPLSERGIGIKKCLRETTETYKAFELVLNRLASDDKISDAEFQNIWADVQVASGQIEEMEKIFDIAKQLHGAQGQPPN